MSIKDNVITKISYLKSPFKRETICLAKSLKEKTGIEIGGPSSSFSLKSFFPIYLYAKRIDGVNFSNETIWEGKLNEGFNYSYYSGKECGYQYIDEAVDLNTIYKNDYEFVLSCHSLEHIANPIKALIRWNKLLKPGGKLCLILPDKKYTFDFNRPYTTFSHLIEDYKKNIDEHDETHFKEVIQLHDLSKDVKQNKQEFIERTRNNFINRCVHHHVFSFELINELLNYCGFETIINKEFAPFHLFTFA
ncbi:MAG: methyltransferase domain-containing protein [Arachidicoccus sp.]|nr:methyltransferase domain-containing protein [Arachidicoccus sp.]